MITGLIARDDGTEWSHTKGDKDMENGDKEQTTDLEIVDEKLEAAIAPIVNNYSEIAITKELFKKYCVPGATEAEIFFCMGKTRALGLDPLLPGYVHYIKFPGKPYDLFVGYPEYLKQAYANGLEHLSYEFTKDEDGLLLSVITTLDIKGRDKPFVWETWYDEVVALTKDGVPNWRWKKAPRSQLRKCGEVDTIRHSGLLTMNLPYTPEEMSGEPVADGYRSIPQSLLDAHEVPALEEAIAGEVSADYHKPIDEWRKAYHATWKDEEIFADDAERHAWELAIFDKTSSADFDILEYRQAFREFDSGSAARWVQEYRANDKPKPDPPTSGGDPNLDNYPDVPEEHADETPISEQFITEAEKRFLTTEDRNAWQGANLSTEETETLTPVQRFALLLERVMELPVLASENTTDDDSAASAPAKIKDEIRNLAKELGWGDDGLRMFVNKEFPRDAAYRIEDIADSDAGMIIKSLRAKVKEKNTQSEPEEEQEPDDAPASKATLARLSELVKTFPGAKYMTVKSNSFKERAAKAIGRTVATIKGYTEQEAQAIIVSLEKERLPLLSADELSKQHAEDDEAWFRSPERSMAMADYNERIKHKFSNPDEVSKWQEEHTGINTTSRWHQEHFDKANDALDREELVKQAQEEARAEMAEEDVKDGEPTEEEEVSENAQEPENSPDNTQTEKISWEQSNAIYSLLAELLPGAINNKGESIASTTVQARHYISEAIKRPAPGIDNLTSTEADDVILALKDKLTDRKAEE